MKREAREVAPGNGSGPSSLNNMGLTCPLLPTPKLDASDVKFLVNETMNSRGAD